MDDYPAGSLDISLPFLAVAGLTPKTPSDLPLDSRLKDQAILIRSDVPCLETDDAKALREYISSQDGRDLAWHAHHDEKPYRFRVEMTGRVMSHPFSFSLDSVAGPLTF